MTSLAPAHESLACKRDQLLRVMGSFQRCVVAFSGGVDSAVVAKAAVLVHGTKSEGATSEGATSDGARVLAVTGTSPSLASGELEAAVELARQIGIPHRVIATREFENPEYLSNAPDRCFHCKSELYSRLESELLAEGNEERVLLNGLNADDTGDYRPGMRAAAEHRVRSPLMECGFTKQEVRELAAHWQLKVWDKPATPCLSSRVAYGEAVTPARLAMIDRAEQFLQQRGFRTLRVRYHRGDLARIEVRPEEFADIVESGFRDELVKYLHGLGFRFVTLDLSGFRSGSLNALLGSSPDLVALQPDLRWTADRSDGV